MRCYVCEKEIDGTEYILNAMDTPYLNLYRHKACKEPVGDELVEKVSKYIKNMQVSTKKRKM